MSYTFNTNTIATVARALELDGFMVNLDRDRGECKVSGMDRWNGAPTSVSVVACDNGVQVSVWQDGRNYGYAAVMTGDSVAAYRLAYDMAELNIAR